MGGKKLYKSETNKKLAGVCAGVADYFEIDPTIVRIVWFVVTWFYGAGIILYIAGALILPNESIAKAQMAEEAARPAPNVHVEPLENADVTAADAAANEGSDVNFSVKESDPVVKETDIVEFNMDEPTE